MPFIPEAGCDTNPSASTTLGPSLSLSQRIIGKMVVFSLGMVGSCLTCPVGANLKADILRCPRKIVNGE